MCSSDLFVEESEGAEEFVEGGGLVVGVSDRELRACSEARAEGEKKEGDGEDEGFERRATQNRDVKLCGRGKRAPIIAKRD